MYGGLNASREECKLHFLTRIFTYLLNFIGFVFLKHKTILKSFFAEPVKSCTCVMGAIGGPCSGHLSLSQVALMEGSAVGQMNSLLSISQTWAESPGKIISDCE